ncbi:MAG: hypothetical protein ABJO09_05805 [Hyphomicrobiales bacterium]|uniref:hypothetical protein n=1 Tax=Alphaproteobacteria TaxID=28211 RepID=UPI00329A0080
MSQFGKGYSKSNGHGRTNHYNGNGKYTGHSQTNSRGVTSHHTASGKHTGTTGRMNFGNVGGFKSGGGKGKAGF